MSEPEFRFRAIGVVRSPFRSPEEIPVERNANPEGFDDIAGSIELEPELTGGLKDIDGFSHLIVLFVFHRAGEAKLLTRPPFDGELRGVFASRSPHRPNPIGMTVVRYHGRTGASLRISGLDMIDGTPVLDIKPYLPRDQKTEIRTGWVASRGKTS
jgi:tRNA (adenine37-N6)-methyltransferase